MVPDFRLYCRRDKLPHYIRKFGVFSVVLPITILVNGTKVKEKEEDLRGARLAVSCTAEATHQTLAHLCPGTSVIEMATRHYLFPYINSKNTCV